MKQSDVKVYIHGPRGITTAQWKAAGLPFESFLRYVQLSPERREMMGRKFAEEFPDALNPKE